MGLCYEHNGDRIEIHLARKDVLGLRNDIYHTFAHELLHARQTAKGIPMHERPVRKYEDFIYELAKERM